jgi:hypothetical protein
VYRLTTDGTIDRRMVERATGKRRLEKIVIKKGRFQGGRNALGADGTGISAQELLELLNSKDYVKTVASNGYGKNYFSCLMDLTILKCFKKQILCCHTIENKIISKSLCF